MATLYIDEKEPLTELDAKYCRYLLKAAVKTFVDHKWTKKAEARRIDGTQCLYHSGEAISFCLSGALNRGRYGFEKNIRKAVGETFSIKSLNYTYRIRRLAEMWILKSIKMLDPKFSGIVHLYVYNDQYAKDKREIISVIENTIDLVKEGEKL